MHATHLHKLELLVIVVHELDHVFLLRLSVVGAFEDTRIGLIGHWESRRGLIKINVCWVA